MQHGNPGANTISVGEAFPWLFAGFTGAMAAGGAGLAAWHALRVRLPMRQVAGRVTLILPLTGAVPRLEGLFGALAQQTLRPRRLIVAVEGPEDAAAARAAEVARLLPFPMQLAFAGRSDRRAHKCTNLIAGFRLLDAEDDAAVMLDADILPQPWWLSALATSVLEGRFDLASGYRWPLPGGAGPVRQAVSWFDRAVAVLPKFARTGIVWGGSLAFSRRALGRLDIPAILDGAILDDLSLGAAARRAGLRVMTRRVMLLPTPEDSGGGGAFMRRQMQLTHLHRPLLWRLSLVVIGLDALGWAALLLLLPGSAMAQALVAGALAMRLLRWRPNDRLGAILGAPDPPAARRRQLAIALVPPFGAWLIFGLMLRAWRTRILVWAHMTYALDGPGRTRVLRRAPPG